MCASDVLVIALGMIYTAVRRTPGASDSVILFFEVLLTLVLVGSLVVTAAYLARVHFRSAVEHSALDVTQAEADEVEAATRGRRPTLAAWVRSALDGTHATKLVTTHNLEAIGEVSDLADHGSQPCGTRPQRAATAFVAGAAKPRRTSC